MSRVAPAVLALGAMAAHAQAPSVVDSRMTWRVGFSALRSTGVTPQNSYLSSNLPLLLRELLASIVDHEFSDAEVLAHRQRVRNEEITAVLAIIGALRRERDEVIFLPGPARLEDVDEKLERARERLLELQQLPGDRVEVASSKPVEVVDEGTGLGLLPPPDFSTPRFVRAHDLDLLVSGELEQVGDILVVELAAFDAARALNVWTFVDAGAPGALIDSLDTVADELARVLMGHEWARLTVEPTPADSVVRLDGALIGIGVSDLRYTRPGVATISVSRTGYVGETRQIDLETSDRARVVVTLEPTDFGTVIVDSTPRGASVYLASRFVGSTPVRVARAAGDAQATLERSGFELATTRIGPSAPDSILISLVPTSDEVPPQVASRTAFYEQLGWLAVSLGPPLVIAAVAADFAQRSLLATGSQRTRLLAATGISGAGAAGGAILSAVLLNRTLRAMVAYANAADRPAG